MNFYKELEREFKAAGICGAVVTVPEVLKPTSDDFAKLERQISIKVHENEIMLAESDMLAARTALC